MPIHSFLTVLWINSSNHVDKAESDPGLNHYSKPKTRSYETAAERSAERIVDRQGRICAPGNHRDRPARHPTEHVQRISGCHRIRWKRHPPDRRCDRARRRAHRASLWTNPAGPTSHGTLTPPGKRSTTHALAWPACRPERPPHTRPLPPISETAPRAVRRTERRARLRMSHPAP